MDKKTDKEVNSVFEAVQKKIEEYAVANNITFEEAASKAKFMINGVEIKPTNVVSFELPPKK